mmetsp:Transcript_33404/g.83212  ORF Transcript_33404/g.83212 Transcript_33404/m.83212 type:complete len:200 (-) Transcript_33404:446-1045(-)
MRTATQPQVVTVGEAPWKSQQRDVREETCQDLQHRVEVVQRGEAVVRVIDAICEHLAVDRIILPPLVRRIRLDPRPPEDEQTTQDAPAHHIDAPHDSDVLPYLVCLHVQDEVAKQLEPRCVRRRLRTERLQCGEIDGRRREGVSGEEHRLRLIHESTQRSHPQTEVFLIVERDVERLPALHRCSARLVSLHRWSRGQVA